MMERVCVREVVCVREGVCVRVLEGVCDRELEDVRVLERVGVALSATVVHPTLQYASGKFGDVN